MKTALDTNVLSVLWAGSKHAAEAERLLGDAREAGAIVLCPVVFAEMLAFPGMSEASFLDFLTDTGVMVDYDLTEEVWHETGRRFAEYAERRRRSLGGVARRLLADFIVGAHALLQADRLFTFDTGHYRSNFPELRLIGKEAP